MGQALYDTFNARYLTYQEVAESFVMTQDHFDKLIKNNHTLLMGPRGCGKTTLLKMLTLPAIKRWDALNNTNFSQQIPFNTVYVPTDIQWKRQLEELGKHFPKDSNFTRLISTATVTVNILLALCESFSFLVDELQLQDDSDTEIKFCRKLTIHWKLKGQVIPSINGIRIHLLQFISELNARTKKAVITSKTFNDFDELVYYDFIALVKLGCETFEETFNSNSKKKWALCFDELEIAPDWLQFTLLESLRSSDQKYLYKLTTAPIISLYKEITDNYIIQATENNDFNVVRIWTTSQSDRSHWYKFCDSIADRRIANHFDNVKTLVDIIGESDLDFGIIESNGLSKSSYSRDKDVYGHQTPTWYVFTHLAKIDRSFNDFLEKKKINPKNPIPKNTAERNEVFRKMRQLAIYRYHFRKENSSRRSRKVVPLYFGKQSLFDICDGNPRLFIGLLDEIIKNSESGLRSSRQLSINQQSRIMTDMSEKYISVLAAYPGATIIVSNHDKNIKELLDEIGDYFYAKLTSDEFTIDPSTSFKIDQDINSKYLELLQLALYLGAIVYIENKESISERGIVDKKFRLSYILSPYFRILLREYKEVQLSTILKRTPKDPSQFTILN